MKKVAFITGTSKGIGKAITNLLLSKNYTVFGYARTNTCRHANFNYTKIDLSDLEKVKNLTFPKLDNIEVLLINNAASIGKIVSVNHKQETEIINNYNLNIITPTLLCSKFINSFAKNKKMIINISSGAANNSIASWSTYCATKAALDRLTDVIAEEKHKNLTIFSIHPGIVDTEMQKEIRNTSANKFPLLDKYISYYKNNELEKTQNVAHKLLYLIENYSKNNQNILSIRDVNIN